ncbi:MAG: CHRD domain-containing protein [Sphingomonadaceae bacterium]
MRRAFSISTATIITLLLASSAQAAIHLFGTELRGDNEVPPVATPATGEVLLTLDDIANTLRIQATFSGLVGTTTVAHIHCCTLPGANAGVATTLPTFPGFPAGVSSGSYDQTFSLLDSGFYSPAFFTTNGSTEASAMNVFVSALNNGTSYFNIHTSQYPGGEIRGQISVVPEAGAWAMMIVGFGVVGLAARRRGVTVANS